MGEAELSRGVRAGGHGLPQDARFPDCLPKGALPTMRASPTRWYKPSNPGLLPLRGVRGHEGLSSRHGRSCAGSGYIYASETLLRRDSLTAGVCRVVTPHVYAPLLLAAVDKDSNPVFTVCCHRVSRDHSPPAPLAPPSPLSRAKRGDDPSSAARFLKKGYYGMCCFAFGTRRDGSYRFLEVNARPGCSSWSLPWHQLRLGFRRKTPFRRVSSGARGAQGRLGLTWAFPARQRHRALLPNVPVKERVAAWRT